MWLEPDYGALNVSCEWNCDVVALKIKGDSEAENAL